MPLSSVLLCGCCRPPRAGGVKPKKHRSRMPFGGGSFPARYSDLRKIGVGAQGEVYSARDTEAEGRQVVIKRLSRAFDNEVTAKHAFREFSILRFVDHCNVIRMLDVFTPQRSLADFSDIFLVMEHMEQTLDALVRPPKVNDFRKISFLTYQLLCGVNYLHKANIIHRDLKPNNVAVNRRCELKIIDFGLARQTLLQEQAELAAPQMQQQMTPYVMVRNYRAPEIFFKLNYNENADIWSIGCIVAELFLGRTLFEGNNDLELVKRIVDTLGTPSAQFIARIAPEKQKIFKGVAPKKVKKWENTLPEGAFPAFVEDRLSAKNVRDLISQMLVIDPEQRIPTQRALAHSFVHMWYRRAEAEAEPAQQYDALAEDEERPLEQWMALLFYAIKEEHANREQQITATEDRDAQIDTEALIVG